MNTFNTHRSARGRVVSDPIPDVKGRSDAKIVWVPISDIRQENINMFDNHFFLINHIDNLSRGL